MDGLSPKCADYDSYIEQIRKDEYPMLKDAIYLDHAGTTLYSKTLMDRFHSDLVANLYGNPHSISTSSQRSAQEIETVRIELLKFLKADPGHFDLIFTANATAAIKLVMEAFREQEDGFWYGYHIDSHTSLVGVREAAREHVCFETDADVEGWVDDQGLCRPNRRPGLFAYPAQSNMNGRRLPLSWCRTLRKHHNGSSTYTLLDAAAYASTSQLDLSDSEAAPDFTALSLYKIFGFPDLGALIVRKDASNLFQKRKYFGGGTVDMVACIKEQWHAPKEGVLHEQLEDGTLPFHSIIALKSALQVHTQLFGQFENISMHTAQLAQQLYSGLSSLRHGNGKPVCTIYKHDLSTYADIATQGPIVAFNLRDSKGNWVSNSEVEKLATIKNIHLRTGGVCSPGGVTSALNLAPWELRENFSAGHRCSSENDIVNGKPTGVIRVSLGAMSTMSDVTRFLDFVHEFFADHKVCTRPTSSNAGSECRFYIESITVYPIKSCAGWHTPPDTAWHIHKEGLSWDREWCVVHQGTGKALSQKQHPRMALIRPEIDFKNGVLRIHAPAQNDTVVVPLSKDPTHFSSGSFTQQNASVCGEPITARLYASRAIAKFFSNAVGVPCSLARFPFAGFSSSARHSKAHLQQPGIGAQVPRPILLSNESPILTISRSSLNRLNEQIKANGGRAVHPSAFRANIVLAESPLFRPGQEKPWAEDGWQSMRIRNEDGPLLEFLGGCRRCQMVCIDQENAQKYQEPFVTLAKTRRFDGKVLFGVHTALSEKGGNSPTISVGDAVETFSRQHIPET